MLGSYDEVYQGIEGLEHSMEYGEKEVTEKIVIDFGKVDFEKLTSGEIPGIFIDEDAAKSKRISLEASEKSLLENGFTEKK